MVKRPALFNDISYIMNIKYVIFILFLVSLIVGNGSCSSRGKFDRRVLPKHDGVAEAAQKYVDEWIELSKQNNIAFRNKATLGFTKITEEKVIGICYYGLTFREIEIDRDYFVASQEIVKKALIFHELTHCYCTRGHTHSKGIVYPDNILSVIINSAQKIAPWCIKKQEGYFDDYCAKSIMHPTIQSQLCLERHWDHYIKEMFDDCRAI